MNDTHEMAPEINAGQQLMEHFQEVWATAASFKRLGSVDPVLGLEGSIREFDIRPDSLEILSPEKLAEIGRRSLRGYFAAEIREEERKQALTNKIEAEQTLLDSVRKLSGRSVTVEALKVGDKPIFIEPNDGFSKWKTRSFATVTGVLTPHSAENYWGQFTPYNLELARSRRRELLRPFSHYVVRLRDDAQTDEPRVALTIE